jgi:hypothetical protein
MRLITSVLVGSVGLSACAANPATSLQRTGEPLRLSVNMKTVTGSHYEVSDTDHGTKRLDTVYDSSEYPAAWRFYQGDREIDEHDYFRLAGDQATADKIAAEREEMVSYRNKTRTVTLVSAAAVVAGFVLIPLGGGIPEETYDATGPHKESPSAVTTAGAVMIVVGTVVGGIAGLLWKGSNTQITKPMRATYEAAAAAAGMVDHCLRDDGTRTDDCKPEPAPSAAAIPMSTLIESESRRLNLQPRSRIAMRADGR